MFSLTNGNNAVVGTISIKLYNEDVWVVDLAAATHGFGPVVYDFAMKYTTNVSCWLASNRVQVKPEARRVWNYYLNNRSHELDWKTVDGFHGYTDGDDDCTALNLAFRFKTQESSVVIFLPMTKQTMSATNKFIDTVYGN